MADVFQTFSNWFSSMKKNGRRFPNIFRLIFFNDNGYILIQIWLKYVPNGAIDNNPALVHMAWHRPGEWYPDLVTHICVSWCIIWINDGIGYWRIHFGSTSYTESKQYNAAEFIHNNKTKQTKNRWIFRVHVWIIKWYQLRIVSYFNIFSLSQISVSELDFIGFKGLSIIHR